MTQEDKELLLKDLSARLPYNVIINCTEEDDEKTNFNCFLAPDMIKDIKSETSYWIIKPYLRPMSSMIEEEKKEYKSLFNEREEEYNQGCNFFYSYTVSMYDHQEIGDIIDWLNSHHFDYRGLIEKGLALEAPKGMYK